MRTVKRQLSVQFSCKAIGGPPEHVPLSVFVAELEGVLVRGFPFPSMETLDRVFARGHGPAWPLPSPFGERARGSTWRAFVLEPGEYEELRLECVTNPALGLVD